MHKACLFFVQGNTGYVPVLICKLNSISIQEIDQKINIIYNKKNRLTSF